MCNWENNYPLHGYGGANKRQQELFIITTKVKELLMRIITSFNAFATQIFPFKK